MVNELISKEAKPLKSCTSLYNKQKLTRKGKNYEANKENSEFRDTEDKQHEPDIAVKSKRRRRNSILDG